MLKICHVGLLETYKAPEGGHRRIWSDPYPLGSSKVSSISKHTRRHMLVELDVNSLNQYDSLSTKVTCGTYGLECDGELREGGSESELSCQPTTEFPGRSLQQVKIASPSSLSRSESSPSFGNIVRGGSSSLKMKEMAPMNPPSEALSGKTSYNHDIATAMVHPSSLNTSSHPLFTSGGGGVHAFLDSKFIPPLKKRSESFHERGAGNLDFYQYKKKELQAPWDLDSSSSQSTQKKPSIHLSPDEHTRDLKLDEFPFVLPQPGCKSKTNYDVLFQAVSMREMGKRTKEADNLRNNGSSASSQRDKEGKPWFNSITMKWEGFDEPDLAGFSSTSDSEEGWEDTKTSKQQLPRHISRDFSCRAMPPKQEKEMDFNGTFVRDSKFVVGDPLHYEDDVSSSSADRAAVENGRSDDEMWADYNVLGCAEEPVLPDHHQQPFITRGRSRSLASQSSSLSCRSRKETFTLEPATKILFDACEERHLKAMHHFLGPLMHAEELMRDRERLMSSSGWRRLLSGGLAKGCQPRARSISDLCRKEEYHHFTTTIASKDRSELQSAQMGGDFWLCLSPSSTSSVVGVDIFNGSDDDSSGEQQKNITLPRRNGPQRRYTWPERDRDQCGRLRHAQSSQHGCKDRSIILSCSECVKYKMERRKKAVADLQGSDAVILCSSSADLTAAHLSLSGGEKDVTDMATNVHETGHILRGITNLSVSDTEASTNTPQKSHQKNVSCNDLVKPANFQPSAGDICTLFTSSISSSNKEDAAELEECCVFHNIELRIKALCQRMTLGKEKLAMVLDQS